VEHGAMSEIATIIADSVTYYHENDEATFFGWLDRMEVVSDYEGRGTALLIRLARTPTDDDLWELLALHQRYGIDMRQLASFQTAANAEWFCAPDTYWHQAVFSPAVP
jgi:hypothetical protein